MENSSIIEESRNFEEREAMTVKTEEMDDESLLFSLSLQSPSSSLNPEMEPVAVKTEDTFRCTVCPETFEEIREFRKHIRVHSGEELYDCEVCEASLSTKADLKRHMLDHTDELNQQCKVCSSRFKSNSELKTHMLTTHKGKKHYTCRICQKSFPSKAPVVNHLKKVHMTEDDTQIKIHSVILKVNALKKHNRESRERRFHHCHLCTAILDTKRKLNAHMLVHDDVDDNADERRHKCEICASEFKMYNQMQIHMLTHTGLKPHTCLLCEKSFTFKSIALKHLRKFHNTENYSQIVSHIVPTRKEQNFLDFQNNPRGTAMYKCNFCDLTFKEIENLKAHQLSHNNDKRQTMNSQNQKSGNQIHREERCLYCELCHASLTTRRGLTYHMLVHTSERNHKCNKCNFKCKLKKSLRQHMRIHTSENKPHSCSICNKSFAEKQSLFRHQEKQHKTEDSSQSTVQPKPLKAAKIVSRKKTKREQTHKCSFCELSFLDEKNLKLHLRSHNKQLYICPVCGKVFNTSSSLQFHKKTHERLQCKICQSKFQEHSDLIAHILTHSNDEPKVVATIYKCRFCKLTFKDEDRLEIHVEKIHGDRPFKCLECEKVFRNEDALKSHMGIPTGEIRFACEICQRKFLRSSCLSYHVLSHFK